MSESEQTPEPKRTRGPHIPGEKPTREEMDARIETAAQLAGMGLKHCDLKRSLVQQYKVDARTADRYVSRARALKKKQCGRSSEDLFLESIMFWDSVIQNPDATLAQRMDARREKDRLLGLHAPVKSEQKNDVQVTFYFPEAPPVPVELELPRLAQSSE